VSEGRVATVHAWPSDEIDPGTETHLHRVARTVVRWGAAHPWIRAGFWYGGFGYREVWPDSDLDVALLLHPGCDVSLLAHALTGALVAAGHDLRHHCLLPEERRIAIWLAAGLTRLDVLFGDQPTDLAWLAEAVDIPAPRLSAAWPVNDSDDEVRSLLARASAEQGPLDPDLRRARAEAEIDKFLLGFDQCSSAHARSDAYAFYFHYNLALGRLIRLVQLTRAGVRHLYLPRNVVAGLMPLPEQAEFRALAGSLYLAEGLDRKRVLAERFLAVVSEARAALGVRRDAQALGSLLGAVQRRDLFFNVRDVAVSFPGRLLPGRFFRGSTLSRWSGRVELVRWLESSGVTDVIDLRGPDECRTMPYSEDVLACVHVHTAPVAAPVDGMYDATFIASLRECGENVRLIVSILVEARGAVVVHCHIGRDRTGWVCALVQSALGLPREGIVRDYLASRMGTRPATVEAFLAELDRAGGAKAVLQALGVTSPMLNALRARLLPSTPSSPLP
jgi:hypothetical protein